jgi:hypothetical protein
MPALRCRLLAAPVFEERKETLMLALLLTAISAAAPIDPGHTIWFDQGFGAPTGLVGLRYTHDLSPKASVEGGLGLGLSGYQVAAMGHLRRPFGDKGRGAWMAGAGLSNALIGESIGMHVPHADGVAVDSNKIYSTTWMNAEGAVQTQGKHLGLRVTLGLAVRLRSNMDDLCDGEEITAQYTDCYPPHTPSAPKISAAPFFPYMGLAYGWGW